MSSKPIVYIVIVFCAVILFCIIMLKKLQEHFFLLDRANNNISLLESFIGNNLRVQECLYIDTNTFFFSGHDSIRINNFTTERKLFYYFSEKHCVQCIEEVISILKESSTKNYNIILLVKTSSIRNVRMYKNNYEIPFPIYQIKHPVIQSTSLESINLPYFLQIDNNTKSLSIFIPQRGLIGITKNYLSNYSLDKREDFQY